MRPASRPGRSVSEWKPWCLPDERLCGTPGTSSTYLGNIKNSVRAPGVHPTRYSNSKISILCILARLRFDVPGLESREGQDIILFFKRSDHPVSYSVGTREDLLPEAKRPGCVMPRSKMSGAIPLLPLPPSRCGQYSFLLYAITNSR